MNTYIISCLAALAHAGDFNSPEYFRLTGEAKLAKVWAAVTKDTTPTPWLTNEEFSGIFSSS
jgi:hypothetical protein